MLCFTTAVRAYADREKIEDAVEHAVTECIQKGILSGFLTAQRSEVVAMSIFEYNEEEEIRKNRETEYELGLEKGKAEGKAEDILLLLEELGEVSQELYNRIVQLRDQNVLGKWLKLAAKAESIENFTKNI